MQGLGVLHPKDYFDCIDDDLDVGDCVAGKEFALLEANDGANDTCPGDSGGPLYAGTQDRSGNYVRYLIDLTSRSAAPHPTTPWGQGGIDSHARAQ